MANHRLRLQNRLTHAAAVALAVVSLAVLSPVVHATSPCSEDFKQLHSMLKGNRFVTFRELREYEDTFGPKFAEAMSSLTPDEHWIDSGAGHAKALRTYIEETQKKGLTPAKTTGIALSAPLFQGQTFRKLSKRTQGGFQYLSGRYLEEIPAEEIRKAKLITDYFGPLSYSTQVDAVLNKYLEVLETDGKVFLHFHTYRTAIKEPDGGFDLVSWIQYRLPKDSFDVSVEKGGLLIRKLKESSFRFPKLKLLKLDSEAPPMRLFEIDGQ